MNKATLQRFYHGKVTFGRLTLDWIPGHPELFTLELPWNNNYNFTSCIPQGLYNVRSHNSRNHPNTYKLVDVPYRDNILIHIGNYASRVKINKVWKYSDTEGCILIGMGYDEKIPMVKSSVKAMNWMRDNIKGNWCIEVKD